MMKISSHGTHKFPSPILIYVSHGTQFGSLHRAIHSALAFQARFRTESGITVRVPLRWYVN